MGCRLSRERMGLPAALSAKYLTGGQGDFTAIRLQLAADQLEQRCLSRAIPADQANLVAGRYKRRRPLEQGAAFDGKIEIGDA